MLIRGGVEKTTIESSQASSLIISRVFRPLSMMALLYYIFSNNRNIIILSFLLVITILTASPFGMARFQAAALYIPFIITTIPILRRKNIFSLFFIFGLLIVFPFLNNFRYVSEDTQIKLGLDLSTFTQGHYDSYYNFALILTENIISWGRQLLGVFFFWIPRNFWPNKPVGSGHFIADIVHLINPNASCNYFAEGYINFGFLGIFIFTLLLAYITARLDKVYWNTVQFQKNNFSRVIYYVLLGMLFITLRGDLSVGFANTLSFLISIILVKKFVQLNEKNTSD
jgi:oligosaccharide repeat unit polymerase